MGEKNQITEGVIWKQLLLFFFRLYSELFFSRYIIRPTRLLSVVLWVKKLWLQ